MNEMQVFQNSEFGKLGVLEIDGKPYFPATACAKKLGYANPQKAMGAIRYIYSKDRNGTPIKKVEFWTSTECWYFSSYNGGPLELLDIVEHYWGDVPFVEFINNEERIGDFEGIISIIDAYNRVQSKGNQCSVFH